MKQISLFVGLILLSFFSSAQTDTIFRMNGEIILANITGIEESSIKYKYPNENFDNSINKSSVYEIHFKSGRKENYSFVINVSNIRGCEDWEKIQLSTIASEVEGMFKIDDVSTKAEGNSTMSDIGKMQSRAQNKVKILTAMIGGNTAYISNQVTEGAGYGKAPLASFSAIAYTSKKVFKQEIKSGEYYIDKIYVLPNSSYELEEYSFKPTSVMITQEMVYIENGFPRINSLNYKTLPDDVEIYTVIYASDSEIVLSGISTSNKGKTALYNVYLKKY